jgi:thioesterase domain-containing protein/acyl carrier protein
LEEGLVRIWTDELEADHIGINDNFFELGGDSLSAARVCARVQSSLGRPLSVAMLFKTPTIAQLARTLQHPEADGQGSSSLVAIQTGGSRPPLLCLHGRTGDVPEYFALAHHLGPDQPVYGIQARGVDGTEPPLTRFEDMAAFYVKEIRTHFPLGPYLLCGSSLAGLLAWEVAQQLQAQNQPVALLALFDTALNLTSDFRPVAHSGWRFFTRRVAFHFDTLRESHLSWHSYVAHRLKARWRRPDSAVSGRSEEPEELDSEARAPWVLPGDEPEKWPATLLTMVETNWRAGQVYNLRSYPGRLTLFLARESELRRHDPRLPGKLAAGGVEIRWVPGNHTSMLYEPHVNVLARLLQRCIDKAITPAPRWRNIVRRLATSRSRLRWRRMSA